MVIYIYTENEAKTSTSSNPSSNTNTSCNITSYDIKDCVEKNESVIETNRNAFAADSQSTNQLININTASKTELTTLSGIGDVKAEAIITYRTTVGSFKSIEDILNVSGIGDAVFEKIKDYITV